METKKHENENECRETRDRCSHANDSVDFACYEKNNTSKHIHLYTSHRLAPKMKLNEIN